MTTPDNPGTSLSHGVEAAFFDLDKTVIAKAAMAAFRGPLYDGGLLTKRSLMRAVFAQLVYLHLGAGDLRITRMRTVLLRLTAGWDRDTVREIVDDALERVVDPIIYAEAIDLIELHRSLGRRVVIVSTSPSEIVEPLGRYLGVDAVISSQAQVDDRGCYTGEMAFYAYGPYKASAIAELAERDGIDLAHSFAYSDSYTDVPMLEMVGHPVVVNPDRVLQSLARDRGWEMRRFILPVRLRDRLEDRFPRAGRPAVATSAAAIVVVAGAVALGWWLGSRRSPEPEPRVLL